ncbi:MAG: type II secretion system F family protein [Syntrophomonadaceae bacterium]
MDYIIWMTVFICFSGVAWTMMSTVFEQQISIRKRLDEMEIQHAPVGQAGIEDEMSAGFGERVWSPLVEKIGSIVQKYTPVRKNDFIEKKLDYAGRPHGWNASNYLSVQYAAALLGGIFAFTYALTGGADSISGILLWGIGGLVVGYIAVDAYLNRIISKHQGGIEKELPDALDLLTISIEAGLGFDASMQRVVQKAKGPLAAEFNQTIQEMRIGKTRREALRDMSTRNGVSDLTKFVDAIMQADQLGVSLGNVLRVQSDQIRILRRQKVEEQAMKAPVKMLIPMILFIFPAIFLVILGPALLQVVELMKGGL